MKRLMTLMAVTLGLAVLPAPNHVLAANRAQAPGIHGQVWVTNKTLNTVTIYDAASGTVRAVIPVGLTPIEVIIPPGVDKAYVSNEGSNTVSVIDPTSLQIVSTIPMQAGPHHMMASQDGRYLYVGEYNQNTVGVIDTTTDTAVAHFVTSSDTGAKTHEVTVSGDGSTLYAANFKTKEMVVLDAHTGAVEWRLPFDGSPSEVLLSKDETIAFVSIRSRNTVAIVDLQTRSVIAEPFIGLEPDTLRLTPNGKQVVVALRGTPATMSLLDPTTLSVDFVSLAGGTTGHEWLSPNGKFTWIAIESPASVALVDNATGKTLAQYPYPGGGKPHGVFYQSELELTGGGSDSG